jgi:3D (Asp-Asp-Asp) domain-containing protein
MLVVTLLTTDVNAMDIYADTSSDNVKGENSQAKKAIQEAKAREDNKLVLLSDISGLEVKLYREVEFICTAYSSLPEENGGYTITCNGEELKGNIVANNVIPQNTKIVLGDRVVRVADRGSTKRFSTENRLDVLLERNPDESIKEYKQRVSDYGVKHIKGYILQYD